MKEFMIEEEKIQQLQNSLQLKQIEIEENEEKLKNLRR
jgi:FtsZ-binding cell division protein ZapB